MAEDVNIKGVHKEDMPANVFREEDAPRVHLEVEEMARCSLRLKALGADIPHL